MKYATVYCSQCGKDLGPGDAGVSSCAQHQAKHTPGPWVHHPEDNIITTPNGFCKLLEWQARSMHVSQEERDANARLIAAAPELLAALQKLLRDADSEPDGEYLSGANKGCVAVHRSGIELARAAIAKALGSAA